MQPSYHASTTTMAPLRAPHGLAVGLAITVVMAQGAVAQGVSCFEHFTTSTYSRCQVVANTSSLGVALHWTIDAASNAIAFGLVHRGGTPL